MYALLKQRDRLARRFAAGGERRWPVEGQKEGYKWLMVGKKL